MSAPIYLYIYANGEIFFGNQGTKNPQTSAQLVSCFKINSDVSLRKITQLSGTVDNGYSGNRRSILAAKGGTGPFGNRFTLPEIQ
jgi:hypothetical protein